MLRQRPRSLGCCGSHLPPALCLCTGTQPSCRRVPSRAPGLPRAHSGDRGHCSCGNILPPRGACELSPPETSAAGFGQRHCPGAERGPCTGLRAHPDQSFDPTSGSGSHTVVAPGGDAALLKPGAVCVQCARRGGCSWPHRGADPGSRGKLPGPIQGWRESDQPSVTLAAGTASGPPRAPDATRGSRRRTA